MARKGSWRGSLKRRYVSLVRILKYILFRGIAIWVALVVGLFLTIIIANMGGYVDKIKIAQINETVSVSVFMNPAYQHLTTEEKRKIIEEKVRLEIERLELDKPFIRFDRYFYKSRALRFLWDALTMDFGYADNIYSTSGSRNVWIIIQERLPYSVLLFTTASMIIFFSSLYFGLILSRQYGSVWDRLAVSLAPLSTVPGWFYGLLLIIIFAAELRLLPFGGHVDIPPPKSPVLYALSVVKHMILPILAWFIGGIFIGVYGRRTFFLVFSSEDYVEMAKAKGLPGRLLERRYILRPTLPPIITQFALTLIAAWMGAIITESVFKWPGLGTLFLEAINSFDTPVVVGLTMIYAYLLGATVFILDFIYAIVDPRIRVGGGKA